MKAIIIPALGWLAVGVAAGVRGGDQLTVFHSSCEGKLGIALE